MHKAMRLVIYQPDIAQNLGAMLRTCAGLGFSADIILPCGFPIDDRRLRRAAMDYINILDYVWHDSWNNFLISKPTAKRLVLLTTKTELPYYDFEFSSDDLLMVGRESAGVPDEVAQQCDALVTIPMVPEARSLNVAVAASIVMGEARRRIPL